MEFPFNFQFTQRLKSVASSKFLPWLQAVTVFVVAYGMQRSVALLGLDLHHDAFMFDAAERFLDGEVPFRDFFYQYNLGTVVFHMLALKAFGTYIASLKIATCAAYALIAALIYLCAATLGRSWQGFGMALVWSALSPFYMPMLNGYHAWSTVYMMASVMAGALFLLMATQKRTWLYSGLAGACFCLAFWFKQVAGLQILLVLFWMLLNTRRLVVGADIAQTYRVMLIGFAVGGIATAAPFLSYLYFNNALYDWWRGAFVFNRFFAMSGASSAGLKNLVHTMLPVQSDLGYTSYIWVFLPLFLVVVAIGRTKGSLLPFRSDGWSRSASLLLMLGLAGWIEYFPLSHAFHTQLFMAPVFCLMALGLNNKQIVEAKVSWHRLAGFFLTALVIVGAYEALVHLNGLRKKLAQPRTTIVDEMPAKGIKLLPEHAGSFDQFYKHLESAQRGREGEQLVPLSADPLRAIFPLPHHAQSAFRMGVDWTWPNELVEPGFNQRISEFVSKRKSLIYGDTLLAIPGYIPISLLEMPSPLGWFHSVYVPSADAEVKPVQVVQASSMQLPAKCGSPTLKERVLIPLVNLAESTLSKIDQVHVSIVSDAEFPRQLTALEYEQFMAPALAVFAEKIGADHFYEQQNDGKYGIRASLTESDRLYLSRFFLYRGKISPPRIVSTLAQEDDNRPILAASLRGVECPDVVWSKSLQEAAHTSAGEDLNLALPSNRFLEAGPKAMYVQIVMKDKTTFDQFLRLGLTGSEVVVKSSNHK